LKKRFSIFLKPLTFFFDLLVINLVVICIYDFEFLNKLFLIYISLFWFISSSFLGYYKTNRNTRFYQLFKLLILQTLIFVLGYFSFFGFFREGVVVNNQTKILVSIISCLWSFKIFLFFAIKFYRSKGNNYRKAVVIGCDSSSIIISDVLKEDKQLGYQYLGFFSNKKKLDKEYLGSINESFFFILKNEVDEIFCSLKEINNEELKKIKKFASSNNRVLNLVPNSKEIDNNNLIKEFYGNSLLILNVKKLPLEIFENRLLKRSIDLLFSFFVCVFIFPWLFPIIILLIKIESEGAIIFKQKREGINGEEFVCYKFRSMKINSMSDKVHATENDFRVTKIGAFLRKTSIDELPQFINVFLGQMSVVGPRPHMNEHSKKFDRDLRNYMKRKSVKPGISGLAQVSGYRGEIKNQSDIENRVRLDVFYIENWSFFLDLKIIIRTIFNIFKGDEKAY